MATRGNEAGAPPGCGSHTATAVPDTARGNLYLYNGGSSGNCTGMDIVRINIADPTDAAVLRRAAASRQCHDNNVDHRREQPGDRAPAATASRSSSST